MHKYTPGAILAHIVIATLRTEVRITVCVSAAPVRCTTTPRGANAHAHASAMMSYCIIAHKQFEFAVAAAFKIENKVLHNHAIGFYHQKKLYWRFLLCASKLTIALVSQFDLWGTQDLSNYV